MKRYLALLLALVMLLSASLLTLTSCGEEEEEVKRPAGEGQGNTPVIEGDIFAERAAVSDDLETVDYGGRKFRIITPRPAEVYGSGENNRNKGDLLTDARLSRNETVENRFNVDVEIVYENDINQVASYVSKVVLSGVDEFDLLIGHLGATGQLVLKNLFLNWYDIPNINFDKPWWNASNKTNLSYDGKCILAVSDLNFSAIQFTYAMFFNKTLANAYDFGNLYKVALDGDWTYDYFYSLIKDVYVDDGDGKRNSADFYGYITNKSDEANQWLWAFNNPIMGFDADGVPEIVLKTDKINTIVKNIYDLFYNTKGTSIHGETGGYPRTMFVNGRCMFVPASIQFATVKELRNFEDDYGILPMPKFNEQQQDYYTMAYAEHTLLAVPKTVKDTEFVGTIVEALSAESYKQLTPTFYEIALKTRYLRDSESKKVLDTIIENTVFDFGYVYRGYGSFAEVLSTMIKEKNNNFESYYNSKISAARNHYNKVVRAFDKLG